MDTWDDSTSATKGYLVIQTQDGSVVGSVLVYAVTGLTVATGYYKIDVTYLSGNPGLSNGTRYAFQFTRTGNIGPTGPTGATGPGADAIPVSLFLGGM
jgi:hypothetical protein